MDIDRAADACEARARAYDTMRSGPGVTDAEKERLARAAREARLCAADIRGLLAAATAAQPDPCTRGWLAALADAYHCGAVSGHTKAKLLEVLQYLGAPGEPLPPKTDLG